MIYLWKLGVCLMAWGFFLVMVNPFLENRTLKLAAFFCIIAGIPALVFGGL